MREIKLKLRFCQNHRTGFVKLYFLFFFLSEKVNVIMTHEHTSRPKTKFLNTNTIKNP